MGDRHLLSFLCWLDGLLVQSIFLQNGVGFFGEQVLMDHALTLSKILQLLAGLILLHC